jgi:hypothetical protein
MAFDLARALPLLKAACMAADAPGHGTVGPGCWNRHVWIEQNKKAAQADSLAYWFITLVREMASGSHPAPLPLTWMLGSPRRPLPGWTERWSSGKWKARLTA